MVTRSEILIRGIVQGVGFRPFVYTQASRLALRGRVRNNSSGVVIEVEGEPDDIEVFVSQLRSNPPPLSAIESLECNHHLAPVAYSDFAILESSDETESSPAGRFVPVSADLATCADCLRELFDPHDRRYKYPFINCTNCGPRFTIVEDIPYDRARTTMCEFAMCAACLSEYQDPLNRRFHAEPIACPACGPQISIDLAVARNLLSNGKILAIKGIGGFHLACDGLNRAAVERLRERKYREDKPFALMAASVAQIRGYCQVSFEEEKLLLSEQRPIVLLERKPGCQIPEAVAPGITTLGFMLPYTPLHHLLLEDFAGPLVMTSGNVSDEPICFADAEARQRLSPIADEFLLHDRRIHMRTDDSVARVHDGRAMMLRRARGYAPAPIRTAFKFDRQVLACGAELKNTFCFGRDQHAFVSPHIGNLENLETLRSYIEGIEHFKHLFHLQPEVVAYDLHPEYLSTKYALSLDDAIQKVAVQHHHAHIASCMADNQIAGELIGVALDGLGFGTDGCLWGGEFFVADFLDAERIAHLANVPMPGGTKAIREPWRMAATYLQQTFGDNFLELDLALVAELERRDWPALRSMIASRTNCPETSSMGRLFDAVSSLLGVRAFVNYEGQAAIELEGIADRKAGGAYAFEIDGKIISARGVIRNAVEDLLNGVSAAIVSARFHRSVANLIVAIAERTRAERKLNRVALSGGVFQNLLLLKTATQLLAERGFEVFTHSRVPPNDGGISLGQAAIANARVQLRRV
ncbi:MAG TPA: carbamoyltransferase HypF [Pyrinomonadaceae bacterium]|nr:carbamoyltransferase HypF [Pyrinomonadaceae bacterium]